MKNIGRKIKKEEMVNITEYYNEKGVCVKRTANGVDLPTDTEPSVKILLFVEKNETLR